MARIFVSSIIKSYESFRAAAREGITAAGATPVLVEGVPSVPTSPRNACLDLVRSSDALILIVGPRGGFRSPSGLLVVEEEFQEARRLGRPSLVFLQKTARDEDAEDLAGRVSDYVGGRFRIEFEDPSGLRDAVRHSLQNLLPTMNQPPFDPAEIQRRLTAASSDYMGHARISLVTAPSVQEEVVDPLHLDDEALHQELYEITHRCKFFSFARAKSKQVTADAVSMAESTDRHGQQGAKLEVFTSGLLDLASPLESSLNQGRHGMSSHFEILFSDLLKAVSSLLITASELIDLIDKHARFPTWLYNVSLSNVGHRTIVDSPATSGSYSLPLNPPTVIQANDNVRQTSREALKDPQEARRVASLLRRRLQHSEAGSSR